MLTDAFRAELFKLTRNRPVLIFSYLFLPIAVLLVGGFIVVQTNAALPPGLPRPAPDLSREVVEAFQGPLAALATLFCTIGAAILFAGEFRWETWRLIATRNSRATVMLAKIALYGCAVLATVLLSGLAVIAVTLFGFALAELRPVWSMPADAFAAQLSANLTLTWSRLMLTGAVVALVGVATRSMMAAIIVPIVLGGAQAGGRGLLAPPDPADAGLQHLFGFPDLAFGILERAAGVSGGGAAYPTELTLQAALAVALWFALGYGGAVLLLRRMDLSKE